MPGFFDFFFKDETAEWKETFRVPLALSLYTESVNNVAIGDSFEKLQTFGRPDNRQPFKKNRFVYYSLGMQVMGENGKIQSFDFIIRTNKSIIEHNKDEANYASAEITITTKNGGYLLVNKQTSPADVERALGTPIEKDDEDEDYLSLIYQLGTLSFDFEFGEARQLERLYFGLW
jgi:hypothetical protein